MRSSTLTLLSFPLGAFLAACNIDNGVNGKGDGNGEFDTGNPPPVDTATGDTDSGTTGNTLPEYCEDRHFPGEAVERVEDCPGGLADPDWDLKVKWEVPLSYGSKGAAVVGQLTDDNGDGLANQDDDADIVVADGATTLHAFRARDGREIWSKYMGSTNDTTPSIGDVDGDGFPEVVLDINYANVALDGRTGSTVWVGPNTIFTKSKGSCGAHGIADLEGDGTPEVYLGSQIMDGPTGVLVGDGNQGDGLGVGNLLGVTVAADLNEDGVREVVAGNTAYEADGSILWTTDGDDGPVAVADLDLDGVPELIMTNENGLTVLDNEGDELWYDNLGDALPGLAAVADIDGDGRPEIIVPTANRITTFYGDGTEMWDVSDSSSSTARGGASAYDLDGDGIWEVIWSGPSALRIFDGPSGDTLTEYSLRNTQCAGAPPVVDVDGDHKAEIIAVDGAGSLKVLEDTAGFTNARSVWNQSDYSTTNVMDDGTIPQDPINNWEADNNFRAGPTVAKAQSLFPVVRDVCSDECDRGKIWLWYAVGNNGNIDVTGNVDLEIWGVTDTGEVLLTTDVWSTPIPAGWISESAYVEIDNVPENVADVTVRIVGGGNPDTIECNDEDNVAGWAGPVCESTN